MSSAQSSVQSFVNDVDASIKLLNQHTAKIRQLQSAQTDLLKRIEALESLDHAIASYGAAKLVIEKRRMGEAKSWISSPSSNEDGA